MSSKLVPAAAIIALLAGPVGAQQSTDPAASQPAVPQPSETQEGSPEQAQTEATVNEATSAEGASAEAILAEQKDGQMLTEEIVGASVYTVEDEEIGAIQSLVFEDQQGVVAAVVGVGGFLGIGEKAVAINWDSFKDHEDGYLLEMTAADLESAPEFMTLEEKRLADEQAQMQQQMEQNSAAPAVAPQ